MIIASAQLKSTRYNTAKNIDEHVRLSIKASNNGSSLILFPEMSLTGYEREDAYKLSFIENDNRLKPLQHVSNNHNIVIVAGAPILLEDSLYIGSFIISPNKNVEIYIKQFLHFGESDFFKSSSFYNPIIQLGSETVSFAICSDISSDIHFDSAIQKNTTLYLASIFYTDKGINEAHKRLSNFALTNSINVLMSNYCGTNIYSFKPGGRSAFWNKEGRVTELNNGNESELLIIDSI